VGYKVYIFHGQELIFMMVSFSLHQLDLNCSPIFHD
jgi:hypothetical protein